jgi:predicted nucleotidyltransferase
LREEILIFSLLGSQARGDNETDSDVDICTVVPEMNENPLEHIIAKKGVAV